MLAERTGEARVREMQCFFGDVFERTSADIYFVVQACGSGNKENSRGTRRKSGEGSEKILGCLPSTLSRQGKANPKFATARIKEPALPGPG